MRPTAGHRTGTGLTISGTATRKDLSAHLVFGTATAAAYSLLAHVELEK
jgi:hypothetical protein